MTFQNDKVVEASLRVSALDLYFTGANEGLYVCSGGRLEVGTLC